MSIRAPIRALGPRLLLVLGLALSCLPAAARDGEVPALLERLAAGDFADRVAAVEALARDGGESAGAVLQALLDGRLYRVKADGRIVFADKIEGGFRLADPMSAAALGEAGRRDVKKIKANNKLRKVLRAALGALSLRDADPARRIAAADAIFSTPDSRGAAAARSGARGRDRRRRRGAPAPRAGGRAIGAGGGRRDANRGAGRPCRFRRFGGPRAGGRRRRRGRGRRGRCRRARGGRRSARLHRRFDSRAGGCLAVSSRA